MNPISQTTNSANLPIREMTAADIARCIWVRIQTRENHWSLEALTKAGITDETVAHYMATTH